MSNIKIYRSASQTNINVHQQHLDTVKCRPMCGLPFSVPWELLDRYLLVDICIERCIKKYLLFSLSESVAPDWSLKQETFASFNVVLHYLLKMNVKHWISNKHKANTTELHTKVRQTCFKW